MREFDPSVLRSFADALEDPRQMDNVENCLHFPLHDQLLLLSLHGAISNQSPYINQLPKAGEVVKSLSEHLISVTTADGQSARLGLFFTNASPFTKHPNLAVGIFPIYTEITEYLIRPDICTDALSTTGYIGITDKAATGDPFIIHKFLQPPSLLFFKKSPFDPNEPYKTVLPDESGPQPMYLDHFRKTKVADSSLEKNVIDRALWYARVKGQKPLLYTQKGLHEFIRANRYDERYFELYKYYHARFRDSVSPDAY